MAEVAGVQGSARSAPIPHTRLLWSASVPTSPSGAWALVARVDWNAPPCRQATS